MLQILGGEFEVLQHCSSADMIMTGSAAGGRGSNLETPPGTAQSSATSIHAVFNIGTGKVMEAIKETRELLGDGLDRNLSAISERHKKKVKQKEKKQKKISATWSTEWSYEHFPKDKGSSCIKGRA